VAPVSRDRASIPNAIEETLRADSPVQALMRTTTQAVELGGFPIPAGARVVLLFASANHDETHFRDAGRFDLCRGDAAAHLAFGRGVHSCVGAPLARLEARVALELLLEKLPGLRLASPQATFVANPIYRAIEELPIEWDVRPEPASS
jgi:cytochrome P450